MGSEVPDPGLAGRSTSVRTQVGDGVINIGGAADGGGGGKHVGGVAELELFAEPGGHFVAVHRCVASWQIDHRFHADAAVITEQEAQPM